MFAIPKPCYRFSLAALYSIAVLSAASSETVYALRDNGHIAADLQARQSNQTSNPLLVIGFMGGRVPAGNHKHKEFQVAEELKLHYPHAMRVQLFSNRDPDQALAFVRTTLDRNGDGHLSPEEKSAARIVIFGHSWGASETVAFARRLGKLNIPVLLTIQVDSVRKMNEDDGRIPTNVREAINFYQADGLLHGRKSITAVNPAQTTILGNIPSSYRQNSISCVGYPWYARAFMHSHIEIENDPLVWQRIETLIGQKAS